MGKWEARMIATLLAALLACCAWYLQRVDTLRDDVATMKAWISLQSGGNPFAVD